MLDPINYAKDTARELVLAAINSARSDGALPQIEAAPFAIEIPADTSHGDFASNAAMVNARTFHMAPRAIAQAIVEHIAADGNVFDRVEIAGPGFINFFVSRAYLGSVLHEVLKAKEEYGRTDSLAGQKIMVEYVSANPTGPMHMGNARGGALGDCLASVLDACGADVTREFYLNDAGNQIEKFAKSLEARYLEIYDPSVEFPEDGYHGEDIIERARGFNEIHGKTYLDKTPEERRKALVDYALPLNVEGLRRDLHTYRIDYDVWFRESSLYADGMVNKVLGKLKDKGATYEKDGAVWYKATDFGAEKDEVLVRSNGIPTYFAADIAYHYNKFAVRHFDRVINVWGADHHGHVARLKGAMNAVGLDGDKLDVVIMQMVRLVRDGQPVRMSKRTGKAITLTDLLEEIPIDAARFFFNLREPGSHFDFDLDLAVSESSDNPVYYVQYAHARICSILRNLRAEGIATDITDEFDASLLVEPDELALIKHIAKLPSEISAAAREYDPARITRYSIELASAFHRFYTTCRVKDCAEDLRRARIMLCNATRQTLSNCLALLKITAPETM